jgi:hypothetical protein
MTYEEFKQMLESASENINKTGRLIEFRGKQKNTKEWCFGFYTPAFNEKGEVFPAIASISIAELLYEPVIPETIGQYTGLTDKNGKKIFEGDIVTMPAYAGGKHKAVVYFKNGKFAVDGSNYSFKDIAPKRMEVIGNIHDNPELLKGGAE